MGLTDGQILIWPFDLRNPSNISTHLTVLPSQPTTSQSTAFKDFSLGLLHDSRATFILVTEGLTKEYLFDANPLLSAEFQISLRSFKVKARLFIRDYKVQKIILVIPDLERLYVQGDWRSCQRFTHNLRMAALLSGVQGNKKWKLFEHGGAHSMILQAWAAKDIESISLNTLDHFIELQDIAPAKSLIEACFLLMIFLPKNNLKEIDCEVFRVRKSRSQNTKARKYTEDVATAIRQLFEKKINILIKDDPDEPGLSDRAKTQNNDLVIRPANRDLDGTNDGPTETDIAEIMPMLELPNMKPQVNWERGDMRNWGRQRREVVKSLLTGKDKFEVRAKNDEFPYISLRGWRVRIRADFPLHNIKSVYAKADISSPDTQHEHTCFGAHQPLLQRLAFQFTVISTTGQSTHWARKSIVRTPNLAVELLNALLTQYSDSDKEEIRGEVHI
ncbi:hypothetical protein EDD37DRAFT_604169 [Exophiala viscosa]|uniref:uncharacterized protein n=1 Tax=Exophiala viscosa TaxID=2486360 RepID=UPI002191B6ED|nr:hypothetical protein EDD37DRAFT_604169 [Exophiala viscosa]